MATFNDFVLGYEDDGTVKLQPLGNDFAVPHRFAARTDEFALDIQVDADGSARCVGLILRAPSGGALTAESLRRLPLARLTREAVAEAARQFTPANPGGEPIFRLTSTSREAHAAFYEDHVHSSRTPRQGSPLTDENLRDVARIYREALKRGERQRRRSRMRCM